MKDLPKVAARGNSFIAHGVYIAGKVEEVDLLPLVPSAGEVLGSNPSRTTIDTSCRGSPLRHFLEEWQVPATKRSTAVVFSSPLLMRSENRFPLEAAVFV